MKIRSWVEGPRFARIHRLLRQIAYPLDLEIKIEQDKGWFTETVFFELEGEYPEIKRFEEILKHSIKDYNKE